MGVGFSSIGAIEHHRRRRREIQEDISVGVGATLALRGLLEFVTILAIVFAIATSLGGIGGVVAGTVAALITATVWAAFSVPGDPSRSGGAPIPVRGWIRLVIEIVILGVGTVAAFVWRGPVLGVAMAFLTVVHYASWPARIRWLLAR